MEEQAMIFVLGIVVLCLFVYLFYALLNPDKF
ncbi:K(+)-transporting ATPase subunit F [Clostridium ventriculi]|nr:K(+)-transporting ATPase subunit F [Sarcina ventriculi]